jgi:hypothetical protein
MTDLDATRSLDSEYLGIQCAVHHSPPSRHISPILLFIANIFNISSRDDNGNVRILGFISLPRSRAVFWIIQLNNMMGCDTKYVVCSNYEVTLIEIDPDSRRYTYIIHPVPVDDLDKCELFPRPKWHIKDDYGPVELTEVNKRNSTWLTPTESRVYMTGWTP